ncbi:hypothetical protein EJB05_12154 [Eragrostis curvula]|uniref:F-box domain-containing protein n=1 Tax=Eragrostis curvula TaxID=38414 RepID=A0A5J9VSH5_9POAL|nr:hypothetical protein EJB05_12154 [Eragrostis curvula]
MAAAAKKKKPDRIDGQETPDNCDGDEMPDHISRLPDEVLGTIISLLPTKDGARTQAIARRWRHLWRSAPLNLQVDYHLSSQDRKRVLFVTKILADHPGPARRFSLRGIRLRDRYPKIDGWLLSRTLSGLREIEFSYEIENPLERYPLPPSALRFAPTLCVADIGSCDFPNEMAPSLNFPCLKQLTLRRVFMSEHALHSLLSDCPVLESLLLLDNAGIACLRISSPTLRSIGFSAAQNWHRYIVPDPVRLQELVIEHAPCLERLLPLYPNHGPATIRVMHAPKLEILGLLSDGISRLELGTSVFQEMMAVSLTSSMCTVKILVLDTKGPNLDAVVNFIMCFPCLERLYITSHPMKNMKNVLRYNPLDPIKCLELHLEKVVLKNYDGKKPDVDFAKFFVLNAKVLKKMEFGVLNNCNDKWLANQHRRLQLDNRASQDAEFQFKNEYWALFTNNKHTHDLWMADPFDSS